MKLPTPLETDTPIPWCLSHLLRWPTLCAVCFSLNKSTSYPSLCLSLNSFYDETSRSWASLSPETRCVISVGRLWVWFGFESKSEFWPGLSPGCVGSSPSLRCPVSDPWALQPSLRFTFVIAGNVGPCNAQSHGNRCPPSAEVKQLQ